MKFIYTILLVALIGCASKQSKEDLLLEYKDNTILINYKGSKEYIKIQFASNEPLSDLQPSFCVDSLNNSIFIYVPSFGIKKYDLSNKKLLQENYLAYRYQKMNHSYKLHILNDHVVFSSCLHILIFNKNLEMQASLRDTIERNLCPEFALHYFDTELIGDTILFKAMFVDKYDFEANKRHKKIFKDFEFILSPDKIICNNCDSCSKKNTLTKSEMDKLLKNPY